MNLFNDTYYTLEQSNIKHKKDLLEYLFSVIQDKGFIAGGFAREVIYGDDIYGDIDVFPKNEKSFNQIKDKFDSLFSLDKETKFTYAYKLKYKKYEENLTIIKSCQVGNRFMISSSLYTLLSKFDFTCISVGFYYDKKVNKIKGITHFRFSIDNEIKLLRYNHVPRSSAIYDLYRINKYLKKGFRVCLDILQRVSKKWNKEVLKDYRINDKVFDLNNKKVFEKYGNNLDRMYEEWMLSLDNSCRKRKLERILNG